MEDLFERKMSSTKLIFLYEPTVPLRKRLSSTKVLLLYATGPEDSPSYSTKGGLSWMVVTPSALKL